MPKGCGGGLLRIWKALLTQSKTWVLLHWWHLQWSKAWGPRGHLFLAPLATCFSQHLI